MPPMSTLGPKHAIPRLYAVYILRSRQYPHSKSIYVGSTPDPPKRIRQHNGEILQGAWKTKRGRPWTMEMIIHGFPSKIAALQFEWALQKPAKSRHLRSSSSGALFSRPSDLASHIAVARAMLSLAPFAGWPLDVRLFSRDAAKVWDACEADAPPPTGGAALTAAARNRRVALAFGGVEERGVRVVRDFGGVDGLGEGRAEDVEGLHETGRLAVKDEDFEAHHVSKHLHLLEAHPSHQLPCAICRKQVYLVDHLQLALCPLPSSCVSVAHLTCLATHFLSHPAPSPSSSSSSAPTPGSSSAPTSTPSLTPSQILPSLGACPACHAPLRWGDVVRGCYRRKEAEEKQVAQAERARLKALERAGMLSEEEEEGDGEGQKEEEDEDSDVERTMAFGAAAEESFVSAGGKGGGLSDASAEESEVGGRGR